MAVLVCLAEQVEEEGWGEVQPHLLEAERKAEAHTGSDVVAQCGLAYGPQRETEGHTVVPGQAVKEAGDGQKQREAQARVVPMHYTVYDSVTCTLKAHMQLGAHCGYWKWPWSMSTRPGCSSRHRNTATCRQANDDGDRCQA